MYSTVLLLSGVFATGLLIAYRLVLLPWLKLRKLHRQVPLYGFEDRPNTYEHYVRSTRELHYAAYEKFIKRGLPYRVKTSAGGERVILPLKYLSEIKSANQQDISLPAEMEELLLMNYTGVPQRTDSGTKVVRVDLTRNLGSFVQPMWEECVYGFERYMPPCHDWTAVKPYHIFARVVALISGRMLVGRDLCRNEDWIRLSIDFSTHAFGAARKLRSGNKYPWSMWLASYTEPAVHGIWARRKEAEALLKPVCEERLKRKDDPWWKKPDDGIQWLLDSHSNSGESVDEVVKSQLRLTMAAIHNTTMSVTNSLFDIVENPEYVDILRQEVKDVFSEDKGWTKQGLTDLRKLDSLMKESLRKEPTTPITGKRKILKEFRLHDGLLLPAGTHVAFTADAVNRDAEVYPEPEKFDGLRYYHLRSAKDDSKRDTETVSTVDTEHQFVTATPRYLSWGQGRSACPGRFFASNEIRLMLAYVLQHYEMRWRAGEGRPTSSVIDWNILPDREKIVEFRRR